jgi:hypothetical protein
MNTPVDTLTLVTALVGSLGLPAEALRAADAPWRAATREALRTAQVELYCDHGAAALRAVRAARSMLQDSGPAQTLARAAIDEAAWHIRQHHDDVAQRALTAARDSLA